MKRKLSPWCKEVKKTLIDRDMSVTELCGEVGMCRNYVTTTINGRMYAPALKIIDVYGAPEKTSKKDTKT